jgi:3-methyladenine DNA glycosylase/8-oxoguanine DNA glycosylase
VSAISREYPVDPTYSLAQTCGPVVWSRGRWSNLEWIDGSLVWVGVEGQIVVHRRIRQDGSTLIVSGTAAADLDWSWLKRTQGVERRIPAFRDPIVTALAERFPGLRPHASGSLFDSLIGCIVGQSITVAAAAVVETRLCALFHPGVELYDRRFFAHPTPETLADASPALIRATGVTWKRAEAIVAAAQAAARGELPPNPESNPEETRRWLRSLPLVGPWTAESVLLWGLAESDAYPPGDAALLRAVKRAYGFEDFDHKRLNQLAEQWRPARAWASRLLWTALLGPAPEVMP